MIVLGIIVYLAIAAGFALWDSFKGMPVEWDPEFNNAPPLWLAALAWPIAAPIVALITFTNFLHASKEKRIRVEEQKERLRIAAQKEQEVLMNQLEDELRGKENRV